MLLRVPTLLMLFCLPLSILAGNPKTPADSLAEMKDQISKSFTYQTGKINIGDGLATLQVPKGYRFLSAKQSQYVLSQLWGNPPDSSTLGMLFPHDKGPLDEESYAVEISFSDEGYIEDDDAKDLDYTDLLKEMQSDTRDSNPERVQAGYPEIELVGWASPPFYDSENHKLHWAKELKFGKSPESTLNYNIRILGRKGYLQLNVIGALNILPAVKKDIPNILTSIDFNDGHRYTDFNPSLDKVAAYGVGGLIAGKVLAKVGFFAIILKFWKLIAGGVIAAFYYIRKFLGKKNDDEEVIAETVPEPAEEPVTPV